MPKCLDQLLKLKFNNDSKVAYFQFNYEASQSFFCFKKPISVICIGNFLIAEPTKQILKANEEMIYRTHTNLEHFSLLHLLVTQRCLLVDQLRNSIVSICRWLRYGNVTPILNIYKK